MVERLGKQQILVIEDDPTMAEMVAYNLRRNDLEVTVSSDGAAGLQLAKERAVTLVIVDLMLPALDGIQITRELRLERPEIPILMLTARGESHMKALGFEAGADDYLTKPFAMEELVLRVKALLRRSRSIASEEPEAIAFGDLRLAVRDRRCWIGDAEIEMRTKEFALLAMLASNPGRLFTRLEIAERVWGYTHLDTRTIDTHIKNVRRKLDASPAYHYIETVRGGGYRFRVAPKSGS